MTKAIDYETVAQHYDSCVQADFDIPFFVEEAGRAGGPVLELMAGTGVDLYGDYDRSAFQPDSSPYMIWRLTADSSG